MHAFLSPRGRIRLDRFKPVEDVQTVLAGAADPEDASVIVNIVAIALAVVTVLCFAGTSIHFARKRAALEAAYDEWLLRKSHR